MTASATDRVPVICGLGAALPARSLDNDDIHRLHGLAPAWVEGRTGILRRHRVGTTSTTSDLATAAARLALASAGRAAVDLVIVATSTSDDAIPATAPVVANRLGLERVVAFDLNAACSGFVYGLAQAVASIRAGDAESALVIGAEAFSRLVEPGDATNQAIFGDGAGAAVLRAGASGEQGAVIATRLGADGAGRELIRAPSARGSDAGAGSGYFQMDGREVFKHAVERMTEVSAEVIASSGWHPAQVDWVVPHQANKRILNQVAIALGLDSSKAITHLDEVGNTSAASIPLALARHHERFTEGDRLVLAAFGGGITWGAVSATWPRGMHVPPIVHIPEAARTPQS